MRGRIATSAGPLSVYYLDGVPAQASARYRVFNALEQLRLAGVQGVLLTQDYDPERALEGSRGTPAVLVIHRAPWDERLACLINSAREQGLRVLFDIDDLVFDPIALPWVRALSRLNPAELELYEDGVRRYFRALRSCDAALTTTRALASVVAAEGVPAFVHRNAVDLRSLDTASAARQARHRRDEVVLYYGAGTATHDVDFQECGRALERLLQRHSSVHLLVQGDVELGYGLDLLGARIRRWPWMPWPDYLWAMAQADINLAPLELGNPYSEVKSELKWFEAAVLGLPTIASATSAFSEVIRSGENGFLARTEAEWYDTLEHLVGDPGQRQSIGAAAESEVTPRYHPEAMGPYLVDLLSRIAAAGDLTVLAREMADRAVSPSQPDSLQEAAGRPPADRSSGKHQKLRIGWLAPALPRGGGGARNIMRMARHLESFGHDATLYVEAMGQYRNEREIAAFIQANFPGDPLRVVMGFEEIRPSDALIATFWLTAEALRDMRGCQGKFYLVQDFEPFFYPMGEEYLRAEATYRFGFHHITSGPWCAKFLREQYGSAADYFDFPLDRSIYYPRPVTRERPAPRVLFFSRPEMPRRCYSLGIQALSGLKARLPEVSITLFGSDEVDTTSLPFPCENLKNVNDLDHLAELYSSADAALILSTTNTSLVPFEVVACGCPVVDIDLDVNRVNYRGADAMLLASGQPDALADALFRLLDDPGLHQRHREAGMRLAETLPNEEQAARRVEEIIFQGLGLAAATAERVLPMPSLNGGRGPLGGLALDVTCRAQDGVLGELLPGKEITQVFRCNNPNLSAIALQVASYGRNNACSLEMSLYEDGVTTPVQRIRQSLLDASDDGWVVFRFNPLPDSASKQYWFVISSPDATPGNACSLYRTRNSLYRDGRLQVNGRSDKGALVFQTFVERADSADMQRLIRPELASHARRGQGRDRDGAAGGQAGSLATGAAPLREELRTLGKRLERIEQRQAEVMRRVADLHNFFGAVRSTLPYRAARKIARAFRLARR